MNTNQILDLFLRDHFSPDFRLKAPLFYNADTGIRYEIGNPDPNVSYDSYFKQVKHRALTLFKDTHQADDDLLFIYYDCFKRIPNKPRKFKPISRLLLNSHAVRTLSCIRWRPDEEDDVEDGWEYYRFVLKCKASDIHINKMLFSGRWIYIVNETKKTIFHFYDSRGLDIVSGSPETLRSQYYKRNNWILNYDRERIDSIFS
ncbi:DUF3885 domain-containing protein [Paenibacillus glycanilyticus]|uniref:DUF3885 domain-containing protein n=1 Tax=Paenibacillus glycanilyticus TaxID=126569 RepID=UPI0020420AB3|nr:DUF3885 domain-containing protein [Paenibacillus glycanilyticus]MCM3630805.1 DUF3885 domain-containing protein [Paenibacillus glycanilyticus]